ncbi:MAG: hypothetical protein IJ064_03065 [Bacteroidaceae bacterium]|nr:hypothetical protein [Bacteroidaceae bacterium]
MLTPREAAETYYGSLVKGDVEQYMQGLCNYDSLPEDYRSQLRDALLQYLGDEQRRHSGLISARAVRDTLLDSLQAHVFVELQFGDSTREEVLLPLLCTPAGWRMQ